MITPADMKQAIHKLSNCDVILIDTAGRSQNDSSKIEELSEFITAASPHEIHLVRRCFCAKQNRSRRSDMTRLC